MEREAIGLEKIAAREINPVVRKSRDENDIAAETVQFGDDKLYRWLVAGGHGLSETYLLSISPRTDVSRSGGRATIVG